MSTAPAGNGMPMSRSTVKAVIHRAPPAESPAKVILDGETGLWAAPGGGLMRQKSETIFLCVQGANERNRDSYKLQEHREEDTAMGTGELCWTLGNINV